MGWKGTVRKIGAINRAAIRDAERREREWQKEQKRLQKEHALEQAIDEVEGYEEYINQLLSVHKKDVDVIDWESISKSEKPLAPIKSNKYQEELKIGFFTKLLGREEKKRQEAIEKDEEVYSNELLQYEQDCESWEYEKGLAEKLLAGNQEVKIEIIEALNPFVDIKELGTSLELNIGSENIIEVTLNLHGQDIIPSEKKSLLKSGKVSIKKTPKGEFFEMYQDYVCGCILRIGNELLGILPEDLILIHAVDKMLNTKTGHMEEQCITSIAISRKTIEGLNMDLIDPSDSFDNFVYNMNFKKTKGFESVEQLLSSDFI